MSEDLFREHCYHEAQEAERLDSMFGVDDIACSWCGKPIHIDRSVSVEMPDGFENWCAQCLIDNIDIIQQCAFCNERKHIDFMKTNDLCWNCFLK